jgi:hypothetical protein
MFINGLPVSSLFCYTSLLYLPHYLLAHMPCAFCSSAFYLCHVHSMHHSSSVYFSCCTLPLSTCLNPSQQQHSSLISSPSSSLCAPCACYMHNPSACFPHTIILHIGIFIATPHYHRFTPSIINTLSLFCMLSSCRVLFLIIKAIPHLF